jgi:uncharacterized protein
VGSRQFDLVDLIEEELLLALPIVPSHEVCPAVHDSLVSGASGPAGYTSDDAGEDEPPVDEKPHPFAALASLKKDEGGGQQH